MVETEFLCVTAMAGLELTHFVDQAVLRKDRIKGVCHHSWLPQNGSN